MNGLKQTEYVFFQEDIANANNYSPKNEKAA